MSAGITVIFSISLIESISESFIEKYQYRLRHLRGWKVSVVIPLEPRVVDPYSFFTDPDPDPVDPDAGQYGYGSGSGSNPDPGL